MFAWMTTWERKCYIKVIDLGEIERVVWLRTKRLLDDLCARINENKSTWSDAEFNREIREWLRMSHLFAQQFGIHNVPADIRSAVHEAETILNMQLTNFGPDVRAYNFIDGNLVSIE